MRFFIQPSINTPSAAPGLGPVEGSPGQLANTPSEVRENPHLRSANEVQGYAIQAEDGDRACEGFPCSATFLGNPAFGY